MRRREEVLNDIISVKGNLTCLEQEISLYPWDSEKELVMVQETDFLKVIRKCLEGEIVIDDLVKWANLIECRDDIEFKNEFYQEIIFELANPEINGDITKERLQNIVEEIEKEAAL